MSAERGRPVHLTVGERKLLAMLLTVELERLEAGKMPIDIRPAHEHAAVKFRKLRMRQYRRLLAELRCPRLAEGQFVREPGGCDETEQSEQPI